MTLTTKDIIKMLPFEEAFKAKLLEDFDTLSPDQKYQIEELIWDAYAVIYQLRFEKNFREALLRVEEKKEEIDEEFSKRIREQTNKDLQNTQTQQSSAIDLSETRAALQEIINDPTKQTN